MVAHKCQLSSKDQAHYTDTTATPQYISKCSAVSHHEKSIVVLVWCAWSLDEGWRLWTTTQIVVVAADRCIGDTVLCADVSLLAYV